MIIINIIITSFWEAGSYTCLVAETNFV